jgi:thymidine kinase
MLNIVIGPMCAGKTSNMLETYNKFDGRKVIIDYEIGDIDKCYEGVVNTHDGVKAPCYKAKQLKHTLDIYNQVGNFQISNEYFYEYKRTDAPEMYTIHDKVNLSEAIFINEAQFFPDLFEFVMANINKDIYLYGIDGDFEKNKMGQLLDLIPHCDSVIKLKAKCLCGKPAIFTFRDSPEKEQYLPNAKYIPLCRACYLNKKK